MRYLIFLALLVATPTFGQVDIDWYSNPAASSCLTGSIDGTPITTSSSGSGAAYPRGNSFTVTVDGTMYSVTVNIGGDQPDTCTLRVGTSTDLSTYLEEISLTTPIIGDNEFLSSLHISLLSGVTYYWAVQCQNSTGTAYTMYQSVTSPDGHGHASAGTTSWNLTSTEDTKDYLQTIKLCD